MVVEEVLYFNKAKWVGAVWALICLVLWMESVLWGGSQRGGIRAVLRGDLWAFVVLFEVVG